MSNENEPMEQDEEEIYDQSENSSEDEDDNDEEIVEEQEQDNESEEENQTDQSNARKKVYLPGHPLKKGEELVVDKSAYKMLHQAQSGSPCLSFDIIKDDLGSDRESYPMSLFLVSGTQAAQTHGNKLLVMKMSNLYGTGEDSDSEDEDDSSNSDEGGEKHDPILSVANISHPGCVNRVRCTQMGNTMVAASWSELGKVCLWNLNEQLKAVNNPSSLSAYRQKYSKTNMKIKPMFAFKGHLTEGYGLDWSPTEAGTLATGDCKGNIHVWKNKGGSEKWYVDQRPYNSHAPHSVEDLQWSPNEPNVLASCSVDKSIKIWDTRVSPQSACMLTASGTHTSDVNVISWNRKETRFIVSGGDDGLLCVWDLRQFSDKGSSPVATFKQHSAPVTTVEWHPEEGTVFASGGADDQIAQWDLSVEVDGSTNEESEENLDGLPPQLLFIHQGQTDIKELHWHPQCPGTIVSTAHSGFNIFRTISV